MEVTGTNKRTSGVLVLTAIVWCVLLFAGWYFSSHWEWSHRWGTTWFEIGWVGRAVFVLSSVALLLIWRRSHHVGLATWLLYGVPLVITELLRFQVGVAVRNFAQTGHPGFLVDYAAYSTAYIAGVLLWIVLFPYDQMLAGHFSTAWKIGIAAAAVVVTGVAGYYKLAVISSGESGSSVLQALQRHDEAATLAVFVLLVFRTLAPMTASVVKGRNR